MRPPLAALPLLALPAAATAQQDYALVLSTAASSVALDAELAVELPATVIGDWDPATNPGGTRTLPGLFGGDGNQPIPMEIELAAGVDFATAPTGGLELTVDEAALALELRALEVDLLGGAAATSETTLTLLYDTFRSFQPDSLYIGGFPLELPLGQQALTQALLAQTAPAAGALVPGRDPGVYLFSALVPAELTLALEAAGQPVPVGPLPIALPLAGELRLVGGSAQLTLDFGLGLDQTIPDPLPGFAIEDAPLALPTILPPGQTANLLLDATVAALSLLAQLDGALLAEGGPACGLETYCEALPNSTGRAAALAIAGVPDAVAGELTLTAANLPPRTTGFFVMASEAAFLPGYRGHVGNLCLGPRFLRFADLLDAGEAGMVRYTPDFEELPGEVVFLPGSTWHFQLWYRDQDPAPTWNSSDGARVRFCAGG